METIYLAIVVFLLCLAVFDLFVGVSNDAVNFLNSAIGAKVAKFRTVLIIASAGVAIGAVMSSGMMDVARHGIMQPANFSFYDVMTVFLAVMVTDVIVLDMFNTLGMRPLLPFRSCSSCLAVRSFLQLSRLQPTRRSALPTCLTRTRR